MNMIGLTKLPALRQPVTTILSPSGTRAARTNPMRPAPAASHRLLRRRKFGSPPNKISCQVETEEISAPDPNAKLLIFSRRGKPAELLVSIIIVDCYFEPYE